MHQQKSCRENLIVKTKKCLILKIIKMNLKNLNLVQLSTKEIEETEGGIFLLITNPLVVAFAIGMWNSYNSHNH